MHQLPGLDPTALQHPQIKVGVLENQREITLLDVLLEFLPVGLIESFEVEVKAVALTPELDEADILAPVKRQRAIAVSVSQAASCPSSPKLDEIESCEAMLVRAPAE